MRFRAALGALLLSGVASSGAAAASCTGYTRCPAADFPRVLAHDPQALATLAGIDATEAATLATLQGGGLNFQTLVAVLGEALVFDRTLSVNGSEACALCHSQATGFTGGVAAFARTGGVTQGAVRWRAGLRAPQSLAYAAFAPVLTFRTATQDFAGGNFWDARATGLVTGSPSADQAATPLTSPFEMALPDPACAVRRVALAPYASLFGSVWGSQSLAIDWPKNTDRRCAVAGDGELQTVLDLKPADRARAALTVQQIGLTIAAYEESVLASPFSAKFDRVQAGTASFTPAEAAGYALFTGRAQCSACHTAAGSHALFTDFTSANIGMPRNLNDPFLTENAPGAQGYVANAQGGSYIDPGLGGFLASAADTNPDWQIQAGRFLGAFQVPTLRNVAAAPAGFMRSYGHNGFFHRLDDIVHFLNTRDVLPVCPGGAGVGVGVGAGAGVTCWPAPEQPENINTTLTGNLGLNHTEEMQLVAFLKTLTDGAAQ
jgi:cytochrome c peroxidase